MDILKQIKQTKNPTQSEELKDIKLLLQACEQEDNDILRALGDNHARARAETEMGKVIDFQNTEKEYGGEVYTISQIKKICIDYHLRFLSTKYYIGKFDVEVTAKIKEFSKTHNVPMTKYDLMSRYFIIAPSEMFELKKVSWKQEQDPILFYKINEDKYRLIHKWGNDLSWTRAISGWVNKSVLHKVLVIVVPACALFLSCFIKGGAHPALCVVIPPLLAILVLLMCKLVDSLAEENWFEYDSTEYWDKPKKYF